jgi:hypothetical protein
MVYVASDVTIPLQASAAIRVQEVSAEMIVVRQWFALPKVRVVGAHTGCGCGFPFVVAEEPIGYHPEVFEYADDRSADVRSVRALLALIDQTLCRSDLVELFPVWAGDEATPPLGTISVTRGELETETFLFTSHFVYQVRA